MIDYYPLKKGWCFRIRRTINGVFIEKRYPGKGKPGYETKDQAEDVAIAILAELIKEGQKTDQARAEELAKTDTINNLADRWIAIQKKTHGKWKYHI